MINTHWGGVVEDNSFGTHEFLELCSQLGCEPYINGNVGSGTVQEMSEWVEYITSDCVSPMATLREKNGRTKPWSLKYFGVGNENWGCGGNMRPEYYADLYRRFQTYVRNYGENRIFKIACGPNVDDYRWMEKVMEIAGGYINAITLHYYTVTGDTWRDKGSATEFSLEEYYKTLKKALYMDELISNHTQIMNRFDKKHRVGLIVDEWGTWHNVEPGTNEGFLYQQNTMRDALVAAINLNIFNEHSDRVIMANIAQTVNVLQAVVLTEGEKMVLTPTYHVFDLYKDHQDGTLIDSYLETEEIGMDKNTIPNLTSSVSEDKYGNLHITIANLSDSVSYPLVCNVVDKKVGSVSGRILTAPIGAYNDFEHTNQVKIVNINNINTTEQGFEYQIPGCSVAHFIVK